MRDPQRRGLAVFVVLAALMVIACGHGATRSSPASAATGGAAAAETRGSQTSSTKSFSPVEAAPPASETGGFDGAGAYDFTAHLVGFGPRPPASDAIHRTQEYILTQLKSFGCSIDEDNFHAQTPIGDLAMRNIIAKTPATGQGIILLLTHYDTLRQENFVGAVDGGSSTGLMLEMARVLCGKSQPNAVWIAFLDGEEALVNWNKDNDNTYGSRELAARLAMSGELKRVRAVILADMVGASNLRIRKDSNSTPWLTALVWKTADRLGYQAYFLPQDTGVEDDHIPFVKRGVPSVDIIDTLADYPYWHTNDDTLDKVSPRSLSMVGHVILASVAELERRSHL
jgi:glutaminyl-peptide cyclotransferase